MTIPRVDWYGCYDGSWTGALTPAAFQHPAKAPFALAERIYRHMLAEGWLRPGDRVVDPFAGVACLAFHALTNGLHYDGVELEPKFHALAQENLALWATRYAGKLPRWGSARVHLGDSRNLAQIVASANARVSSPPYSSGTVHGGNGIDASKLTGNKPGRTSQALVMDGYSGAVSSPPYSESLTYQQPGAGGEGNELMRQGFTVQEIAEMRKNGDPRILETKRDAGYSRDAANLGNLSAGDFDAAIASPPYADAQAHPSIGSVNKDAWGQAGGDIVTRRGLSGEYADNTPGQLNDVAPDTFWQAARVILEQTYSVLKTGAVAAWITGDYVRNKRRVPFGEQWLALCEAVGFEPLLWAVAWKTQDGGTQYDIEGNAITRRRDRVSFFRRLANAQNPDAAILNEDVIFVRRP